MTAEELEALLDDLEADLREDVQAALTLTAQDFADAVGDADQLVAAAFSVSRIRDMWQRRVGGIMTRLRRIAGRGAVTVTDDVDADDIPPAELDAALTPYMEATQGLLNAVGDRLAADATASLAEGVAAGESLDELKARMLTLFSDDGTELGPGRAERIAATEATRAFNAGALQAAEILTGPERPIVKQWQTRRDAKVREQHADADGQIQLLSDPFDVGGVPMQYPGDPSAPASLTINCRCILRTQVAPATEGTASMTADGTEADDLEEFQSSPDAAEWQSRMPEQLKRYWLTGKGAAKIRWGTPGDFTRCVRNLRDDFPEDTEGLCANLHHEATGMWPGDARNNSGHTGAMVALVPSAESAARLALEGGEAADQLHVTLAYLGEAADWSTADRAELTDRVKASADMLQPVRGNVFGYAKWNPASDEPAWVWNVGDDPETPGDSLEDAHGEIRYSLEGLDIPQQHSPWVAHVAATYGDADPAELAARIGPVTFDRLAVAFGGEWTVFELTDLVESEPVPAPEPASLAEGVTMPSLVTWSTPGASALAFENQQTGDGRIFAPGALYWSGEGPWPLQYADEMQGGHDGAELAGAIHTISRDGDRIPGAGVLYLTQRAGAEAAMLLAQGAPLGVSVDLDDVDLEAVVPDGEVFTASLSRASMMHLPDGGYALNGVTAADITASSDSSTMVLEERRITMLVGPDGLVPAAAFEITAAAGDPDVAEGTVVDVQRSGDVLMRITRARVRGATLVTIPAYADARIVLDDDSVFASAQPEAVTAAGVQFTDYDRAVRHVRRSLHPLGASDVAQFLKIQIVAARRYLARAAKRGDLVRLTRGKYVAPSATAATASATVEDLVASVTGAVDLPVADRDTTWDGEAAADRVFAWADGDTEKIGKAFAYRDDNKDPQTKGAWKLGYADVDDGELTIVPAGVSAAIGALNGARGGVDLPEDERAAVEQHMQSVAAHVAEELNGDEMDDMMASAWTALADLPAMPAEWFREPTADELPAGGPGVNYANGRIFGWVAQAGSQHAGFAKKVTIDTLGRIDTSHFLRQRFQLDDGSSVKAGAYTMNAGHHRDGAECETAACQFDDTRTVAGIVTVGMNERGMWFSGAAAPWMSEWDRQVFMATQPSYHMKRAASGGWELRAVLSVPVPGHSSPLLASAVVERSQMALTATAMQAEVEEVVKTEEARQAAEQTSMTPELAELVAAAVDAALDRREQRKAAEAAELEALLSEGRNMGADSLTAASTDDTTDAEGA